MLENNPSDHAPVEQLNVVYPRVNRRVPTKAAMIGLAISMGATSLLVTRQSDQALAAEAVGNQNTASTIPAASDTEVKFAPTKSLESRFSSVSVPENHAIVEPTAISHVPGLGAKWQVAASGMSVPVSAPVVVPSNPPVANTDWQWFNNQTQSVQTLSNTHSVKSANRTALTVQPQAGDSEVNAQLKAQQEFALNSLQEKSNRLRKSLAKLRSGETKDLSKAATPLAHPMTVVQTLPQPSTSKTATEQSATSTDASRARLVAKLKQRYMGMVASPMPATSAVVAPSAQKAHEVKPGDLLADIGSNYGTSVSELVRANSLANPNQLVPASVDRSSVMETTVANNAGAVVSSGTAQVANTNANSVIANTNSVSVSVPTAVNTQIQAITELTPAKRSNASTLVAPETVPTAAAAYGMGGDSPIPQAITEMQVATQQTDTEKKAKLKQNPRLRSLQAEIERLREKYRAQQSGIPLATEVPQTYHASEQIPVSQPNNQAVTIPVYQQNNQAVPIPVPRPTKLNYSAQPVRRQVRPNRATEDDAINPEFLANPSNKVATPPGTVDASQSLGNLRGTTVSPNFLPPLAAVDRYLPKPIDETTPIAAGYIWPAKGVLTSGFGIRWGRMHKGIDVANSTGTPVYAAADGVIEKAGWNNGGYGNMVDIRHPDGSMTRYGHNSKILVRAGQPVHQGETIALMGSTGFSTGPHSHFEVHPSGKGAVNPIAFLPRL